MAAVSAAAVSAEDPGVLASLRSAGACKMPALAVDGVFMIIRASARPCRDCVVPRRLR